MDRFTLIFWSSMIISTVAAFGGVWQRSRAMLLVSAILSLPFALLLAGYPASRAFVAIPILHLIAAATVRGRDWRISGALLALIAGFLAWFFLVNAGIFTVSQPLPPPRNESASMLLEHHVPHLTTGDGQYREGTR